MRVAHVINLVDQRGSYGGPLRVALNQVDELRRRGNDVTLLGGGAGYGRGRLPASFAGTQVDLFPARDVVPNAGFAGSWAPGLHAHLLRRTVGKGPRYDVVHVHLGRDLTTLPAARLLQLRGVPYVVQTHGMIDTSERRLAAPLDALMTRHVLEAASRVLVLTERDERDVAVVMRGRPWRSERLANGVSTAASPAEPGPGRPEVLFLGRLEKRKRPAAFVRMAARAIAAGVDARFTLVGADEGELPAVRAAMAGLPDVTYEGPAPMQGSLERLRRASVLVLPTDADTFPMVLLEAMSVGVPVVCMTSCGLAPAVLAAGAGLVVPDGDDDAAAQAVARILGDPATAAAMGRAGRALVEREYSISAVAARLEDLYREAAGRAADRPAAVSAPS
jgi:glycosyltransferase involved in cell wall biosynthesis